MVLKIKIGRNLKNAFGNEIIMNISSVTKNLTMKFIPTFNPTPKPGIGIGIIRRILHCRDTL